MKKAQKSLSKKIRILFLLLSLSCTASAQTSVFQDAGGESAYKIFGTAITVNAKDENISFSTDLIRRTVNPTLFNIFGITAKINASEGIANLKNENSFLLDGEFGIYVGRKRTSAIPLPPGSTVFAHEKYFSFTTNFDRTNLFDLSRFPDKVVYQKSSVGWKGEIGWFGYRGNLLWGVNTSFSQITNLDDLDEHKILTLQGSVNNDSIGAHIEKKAYSADEFKVNLNTYKLNFDIAYPVRNAAAGVGAIFLAGHLRLKAKESGNTEFNPGAGIYLSKPLSPQEIVAGLSVQLNDAFNVNNKGSGWSRISINLTAGFSL